MVYVDKRERLRPERLLKLAPIYDIDTPPYTVIKRAIGRKLKRFPLKEYGGDSSRMEKDMRQCLVNHPQGCARKREQQS